MFKDKILLKFVKIVDLILFDLKPYITMPIEIFLFYYNIKQR